MLGRKVLSKPSPCVAPLKFGLYNSRGSQFHNHRRPDRPGIVQTSVQPAVDFALLDVYNGFSIVGVDAVVELYRVKRKFTCWLLVIL